MNLWAGISWPLWAAQRVRRRGATAWSRLPLPCVSVGNLAFGGRAKTPLTAALAQCALQQGLRPGILTRGYRSTRTADSAPLVLTTASGSGQAPSESWVEASWLRLLSDGCDSREAWRWSRSSGDEAAWLAAACPGVPVAVHPRREVGAAALLERYELDFFLLDDGFQTAVQRDVDLVLVDPERDAPLASRPGPLREGPGALARADHVVLVDCPGLDGGLVTSRSSPPPHWLRLERRPGSLLRLDSGAVVDPTELGPVWLAAGVGRPATVRRLAEEAGLSVSGRILTRDHRAPSALSRLIARAKGASRTVVVTEKDAVGWARAVPPSPDTLVLGQRLDGVDTIWRAVGASLLGSVDFARRSDKPGRVDAVGGSALRPSMPQQGGVPGHG